jgi:S1-C subfamily serine protease
VTSIVYVENWFLQLYPSKGTGSGFLINGDGEILTNNHVLQGRGTQLTVKLADMKEYKAKVLGVDANSDLALIKIDAGRKLPTLHLGDSESLVVGQKVLAIGNPFGFEGTLTTGIVSSLGRNIQTEEQRTLRGMIQTDAAINPGNSGGPLLDSHGNVIGINTAIYGQQGNIGIGFAMPINRAKAMLDEFQKSGHISRPTLGLTEVWVTGDLAEMLRLPSSGGLLIQQVEPGSPAEEAGLRGPEQMVVVGNYRLGVGGDLIVAVEGHPVNSKDALQHALNDKRGGDILNLTIYRNGRNAVVHVKLGEAPQQF